jgi:hypothetical protein
MADETKVKQLSDDEYNRMMHGSFAHEAIKSAMAQGEQAQQQNVQANAAPGIVQSQPAIPPKINLPKISKSVEPPVAGQPDANAVAQQVNKAITNLQISTPPPKPPSSADHLLDQIASNWQIPATVVGIGTAIAGASYLMNRKSLKDRDITNRVEPTLNEKDLYKPDTTAPISKTKSDFLNDYSEQKYGAPLAKLEEISGGKIKSLADVDVVGGTFSKGGNITVNPAGAFTPKADYTKTPVAPTEVAPVATVAPVTPVEKPASKAKKPVDPTEMGLTKQEIGMKRYLEDFYGKGEIGAKTYGQVNDILGYRPAYEVGKGGGLSPKENEIIKGYRKENIEGPKVNLDKEMKRGLKGGLAVGALMAIPGFADAAQKKDYGRMVDLASDFVVPPFAGSTELGVSTLGEKQLKAFENAQKLGSPYRSVPPR